MLNTVTKQTNVLNGIDVDALGQVVEDIKQDTAKALVAFHVRSAWKGQTVSESTVESYTIGGERVPRRFAIRIDEPVELLGTNTAPNPQETLMAALNACMMVGYVAGAAVNGITLDSVEIETDGELDLRGFLGIDPDVPPGYESLHYTVRIKGDGTPEQFRAIHETVMKTSPNYFNMSRAIRLDATLEVG
ncbi:MAG: OsmC family peroxiredoxin [Alphaproteobacteria bacterium]|nr:OsmC family peroxiredoxin [Alphaproteobacteria bacterium]